MALRHILRRGVRGLRPDPIRAQPSRSISQSVAQTQDAETPYPSPPPPDFMIYDRLAESVKMKLRRLENPDSRFLTYNSPHPVYTDHGSVLSQPETKITTLPNGLRVATESNLAAQTATVGVWVDAGSRYETDETNGVAHLAERLIFKGTEKRPVKVLEEEIGDLGGCLNSHSSREQTAYYAKVMGKDVPKALDILADVLQNSVFDEESIAIVRNEILREIEKVGGLDDEVICDQLHATAFQYTPLGRPIRGPIENIRALTKADITNYMSSHYATHRMVITAAGAVKHDEVVDQVKKHFTKLSSNPTVTSQLVADNPAIFTGSEVRAIDDDLPLAQFAVSFSGASATDPDSIALMVIQSMLGSWDKSSGGGKHKGSELAQKVAINEIAESYRAFNTNYKDTGLFGVYAVAKPDCLDDLAYAIMYEISKLCYRVSEADVIRARNQLKSSLILQLDGTGPISKDIGDQLLTYGRRIPLAELFARIDAVDAATVKRVANRFIFDRDVAISARGPVQGLPDYNWFRRRTYWLRY